MPRLCIMAGAILGCLSVAGGAFGAHGLSALLEASGQSATWETAARYCMYHALALVAVGTLAARGTLPARTLAAAAWCFLIGTLIFSGCLAVLALSGSTSLGAVVPVGGVLLIAGWTLLGLAAARMKA
jgi:uncharacterized membrane protein YgdD (TMEM256/DUF423 family)